jgi:signal transduction histidine kinase
VALTIGEAEKTSRQFALFVIGILFAMAVGSYLSTYLLVSDSLDDLQKDFSKETSLRVETDITRVFSTRLAALSDHANLGMIVNAVMHAPESTAPLRDFMSRLQLLGRKTRLILINIDGRAIESSVQSTRPLSKLPFVDQLLEEEISEYTGVFEAISEGDMMVRYAVPVLYNGLVEGVLVAEQAWNDEQLIGELSHDIDNISLEFGQAGGGVVGRLGMVPLSTTTSTRFEVSNSDVWVNMYLVPHSLDDTLYRLLAVIMLVTVCLSGLFLLFFRRLGLDMFVRPRLLLEEAQAEVLEKNQRLGVANEELSQFAYRSSHDLRAPLTTIRGLTQFAIEDLRSGDLVEVEQNLEKVGIHTKRLDDLVGDILDLSRADFVDVDDTPINVSEICAQIEERLCFDPELAEFEMRVTDHLHGSLLTQRTRIAQVLENLISNAIKYRDLTKPTQFAEVTVTDSEQGVVICVEDNGIGIPKERAGDVFQMFKRFHPGVAIGSGLGMSIVKKHIDHLGGTIEFESSAQGTKFKILLPSRATAGD